MEIPKNYEQVMFVTRGIITNTQGEILIVQRLDGSWCLPGGKMEPNEDDPYQSLHREIREETGLSITEAQLQRTVEVPLCKTLWHNAYYTVKSWDGDIQLQADEIMKHAWVNIPQVDNYNFAFGHREIILLHLENIET